MYIITHSSLRSKVKHSYTFFLLSVCVPLLTSNYFVDFIILSVSTNLFSDGHVNKSHENQQQNVVIRYLSVVADAWRIFNEAVK